jgi:sigma-B regulation protein RsbQ
VDVTVASEPVSISRRNHVNVSGNPNGRPVVFAHGFGCGQHMWRHVAPGLADSHRVVLFDHVGSADSDLRSYSRSKYDSLHGYADDVLEIMGDLDLHDAVYVGHSVSSMIGVLAANRDPSRFGALVLVGPSPRYLNDVDYVGGFEQSDIDSLLDTLDANYLGWSSAMAPVIMGNSDRPELGEELATSFCRSDPAIARHFARVTFLSDNRADLPRVQLPTLVLQCTDDIIAPLAVGQYVHEHISRSQLRILSSTGHCPNLSDPGQLLAELQAFLA